MRTVVRLACCCLAASPSSVPGGRRRSVFLWYACVIVIMRFDRCRLAAPHRHTPSTAVHHSPRTAASPFFVLGRLHLTSHPPATTLCTLQQCRMLPGVCVAGCWTYTPSQVKVLQQQQRYRLCVVDIDRSVDMMMIDQSELFHRVIDRSTRDVNLFILEFLPRPRSPCQLFDCFDGPVSRTGCVCQYVAHIHMYSE